MLYQDFMKRLFILLILLILASLIITNWERIQWGTPKAEELIFNKTPETDQREASNYLGKYHW